VIQPEGAAQIALLGAPNTGKSSLHARLTGSGAQAAPYPFTTQHPEPGMMPYEDIHFQLLDLPAISPEHPVSWLASALQTTDACLLVVDLGDRACVERVEALHAILREKRVTLTDRWEPEGEPARELAEADGDPFALRLPAVLLANRADLLVGMDTELRAFLELTGLRYPAVAVSATTGGLFSCVRGVRPSRLSPWSQCHSEAQPKNLDRCKIVERLDSSLRSRMTIV
jgi:50S ribosomal subunit-associated GTPase HflX